MFKISEPIHINGCVLNLTGLSIYLNQGPVKSINRLVGARIIGPASAPAFPTAPYQSALAHGIYIPVPYFIKIGTNGFGSAGIA
jgi:hypothetical protein